MLNIKNCPLRHQNGNCLAVGGFCTAVSDEICYGVLSAYDHGKNDALALLKEQETGVSPKEIKMYPKNVWACGNCGHVAVGSADYKAKYCPECGRAVNWE